MFYRKGKTKPLDLIEKDISGSFVELFISMGELHKTVDLDVASEFVCRMYGHGKTQDVNEARFNKLMQMTGKVDKVREKIPDIIIFQDTSPEYKICPLCTK